MHIILYLVILLRIPFDYPKKKPRFVDNTIIGLI